MLSDAYSVTRESAHPASTHREVIHLGTTTTPGEFIADRIAGISRLTCVPITGVWNEGADTIVRFATGNDLIYRVAPLVADDAVPCLTAYP